MNARETIANALFHVGDASYYERADAVLAVLPELLTDPDIVEAAYSTGMLELREDAKIVLTAAAKALTEGDAS